MESKEKKPGSSGPGWNGFPSVAAEKGFLERNSGDECRFGRRRAGLRGEREERERLLKERGSESVKVQPVKDEESREK